MIKQENFIVTVIEQALYLWSIQHNIYISFTVYAKDNESVEKIYQQFLDRQRTKYCFQTSKHLHFSVISAMILNCQYFTYLIYIHIYILSL